MADGASGNRNFIFVFTVNVLDDSLLTKFLLNSFVNRLEDAG